ncbi:MAG: NAD(P)/FAD-dependent oxidoreductase, partial [Legionella sp.]
YDYLVVATGSTHTYFGHEPWSQFAPGLKTIADATLIRHHILSAFELAELAKSQEEREALMTLVIIGGGPTGVEMAGAISELAKVSLKNDFRQIDPSKTKVILIESGPRLLASFPENLAERALQNLQELGVVVKTGHPVTDCTDQGVMVGDEWIPARTLIWAAGVKASPAGEWLHAPMNRAGRVLVNDNLSLPEHPEIFVIGDTAVIKNSDGRVVPALAPAAVQEGRFVATQIKRSLAGQKNTTPFTYKNYGSMATIGRGKAIADLNSFTLSGFLAWWVWGIIHLMPLIGFRNRFIVACDWLWSYFTFERGVRLITVSKDFQGEL